MAPSPILPGTYRCREPEHTVLHQVVREHLETFLEEGRARGSDGYPRFIEREFRRFLECGLLCHGFARVRCEACGQETLVAFSCKRRVCPSCQGRRMSDTAAYLVDTRLPEAPYRHWVLTLPWVIRYRLSVDRPLMSRVLGTFLRTVLGWQRSRGRETGIANGETGSVTFVQRFGGALNLHPHLHALIPDGLFVPIDAAGPLGFVPLPPPSPESIESVTLRIARRVSAHIERLVEAETEIGGKLEETAASMQEALQRALKLPSPADQLTWNDPDDDHTTGRARLCAKVAGFSLHAGQAVAADDRDGLERLCRYGLRAPFSQERLSLEESGEVVYTLPRPWPNASGVTELVMAPTEFLKRLAALIPSPGTHLIRYHGVFANRSKLRKRVPAPPMRERSALEDRVAASSSSNSAPADAEHTRRQRLSWAQLLARVFLIDALRCPECGGRRRIVSSLTDPKVLRRILTHLELPTEAPAVKPARVLAAMGPMIEWGDADPGSEEDPWVELPTNEDERAPP